MSSRQDRGGPLAFLLDDDSSSSMCGSDKTATPHEENHHAINDDVDTIAYTTAFGADMMDAQGENIYKDADDEHANSPKENPIDIMTPVGFRCPFIQPKGSAYEYLTNKQYSTCHDDNSVTLQKNLIVAFQAHLLLEDCLTKEDGEPAVKRKKRTNHVYSHMQRIIGITHRHPMDSRTILHLLRHYAAAREDHILRCVRRGDEPDHPNSRLNALLHVLTDRYIVFNTTFTPLRKPSIPQFHFRLNDRLTAFTAALERLKSQANDEEDRYIDSVVQQDIVEREEAPDSMWIRLVPMIPAAELEPVFNKPWFTEAWLRKTLPESEWPSKVKRVTMNQDEKIAGPSQHEDTATTAQQDEAIVEQPKSSSTQQSKAPISGCSHQDSLSIGTSTKRKREEGNEEDVDGGKEDRGKVANVETSYYTMGSLVYRSK